MIKLRVLDVTNMQTGPIMKVSGMTINSMDMVSNLGRMEHDTMEYTLRARKKEKEDLHLLMAATTKENSRPMKSVVLVTTTGQTVSSTKDNGQKTKWKDKVY